MVRLLVALLIFVAASGFARAQTTGVPAANTRAGTISVLQEAKAKGSQPYVPNKAEVWMDRFEKIFLIDPSGFYPYFASVYHGGGLTLGAGYRKYYGDNTNWYVQGLYSFKNYKLIEGGTDSKGHIDRRLSFGTKLGWRDATQVGFYGLGMQTDKDNRVNFRFQQTYADGHATLTPVSWVILRGNLRYEHWEQKEGKGGFPSIETVYTPQTAPALGLNPSYIHTQGLAGIDWRRPSPGYTRRGGFYGVTLDDYHATSGGDVSFRKLTGEVIQHVPLLRENWVLAGRGRVETTLNDNDTIPFYLLPALGSGNTLRAYENDRFRDRHSMIMNAEVRWTPAIGLDMALFYDAGKVAARRNDLSFKGLKSDVGIGARFHGLMATPLRVDFAIGNEGWRIVIAGGSVF